MQIKLSNQINKTILILKFVYGEYMQIMSWQKTQLIFKFKLILRFTDDNKII